LSCSSESALPAGYGTEVLKEKKLEIQRENACDGISFNADFAIVKRGKVIQQEI
jgi:hypothetical protein